ncbi:MAG: hypothetical protein RXP27_06405 [Nitrososphaeria archaeon]
MPGAGGERARIKSVRVIVRDVYDRETSLEIKGRIDEESLNYLINNLKLLVSGGAQASDEQGELNTYYSKLRGLVARYLRSGYFTSLQVRELYREMYNEDLKLTTISTYLGRMVSDGLLRRIRYGKKWIYEYVDNVLEEAAEEE